MLISICAAMDVNAVIGDGHHLPWHLPDELKRFRRITVGKPIVMGRRTYESIGKPLPERQNIVLSTSGVVRAGCIGARSLDEALGLAGDLGEEVVVIGGGRVFAEALPRCERMYLSIIRGVFPGEVRFPIVDDGALWQLLEEGNHKPDALNAWGYRHYVVERLKKGAPAPETRFDLSAVLSEAKREVVGGQVF